MTAMGHFLAAMPALGLGYFTARAVLALLLGAAIGLERLQRSGRDDVALEGIVSRVSLEPSVSSVTWSTREQATLPAIEE
jgi:hypothetical protein